MFRALGIISLSVAVLGLLLAGTGLRQTGIGQTERADRLEVELAEMRETRDALLSRLAVASAQRAAAQRDRALLEDRALQLARDRAALAQRAAQLSIDRVELVEHIAARSAQNETLARQRDEAVLEAERLAARLEAVSAERLRTAADTAALADALGLLTGDEAALRGALAEAAANGERLHANDAFQQWRRAALLDGPSPDARDVALAELQADLEARTEGMDTLTAENRTLQDRLEAATAQATAQAGGLEDRLGALEAENAALLGEVGRLTAAGDALLAGVNQRDAHQDRLRLDLADLAGERDALESRAADLAGKLDALTGERDGLESQLMGLTIERDGLRDEVDAAEAALDRLEGALAAVTAERDGLAVELKWAVTTLTQAADRGGGPAGAGDMAGIGGSALEMETFEDQIALLSTRIEQERRLNQEATADNGQLKARIATLEQEIAELKRGPLVASAAAYDLFPSAVDTADEPGAPRQEGDGDTDRLRTRLFRDLLSAARSDEADGGEIIGSRLVLNNTGLFDQGSARLSSSGQALLGGIAPVLIDASETAAADWVLRIEGHTDATPIVSSGFASNLDLSVARAKSVADYLAGRGVPPRRLAVAGFGAIRPLADGTDDASLARNRRVEFALIERGE